MYRKRREPYHGKVCSKVQHLPLKPHSPSTDKANAAVSQPAVHDLNVPAASCNDPDNGQWIEDAVLRSLPGSEVLKVKASQVCVGLGQEGFRSIVQAITLYLCAIEFETEQNDPSCLKPLNNFKTFISVLLSLSKLLIEAKSTSASNDRSFLDWIRKGLGISKLSPVCTAVSFIAGLKFLNSSSVNENIFLVKGLTLCNSPLCFFFILSSSFLQKRHLRFRVNEESLRDLGYPSLEPVVDGVEGCQKHGEEGASREVHVVLEVLVQAALQSIFVIYIYN
ncbi:unnamed protein product [Leptidea sinapis]|uniref:Uncharacterized protein n=1 Tax=Leptidea sinapis TaxID=189913 RepID=A0A5E4QAR0_9NEOP|nr:unnamed protein product [Leptidea sinapis]